MREDVPVAGIAAWPATPAEARALQERLRPRVETVDRLGGVCVVAGADVHYDARRGLARAAVVALEAETLAPREQAVVERRIDFPYVPGLLAFREAPAVLAALQRLAAMPDLLLVDGHGTAHPRGFGLACHLGVLADLPTIGVAKSCLVGDWAEPARERGARAPLLHRGAEVGAVLRTRTGVRPVFVSIGHRVSLATAVDWTLACARRFRLPEPVRLADRLSRAGPAG